MAYIGRTKTPAPLTSADIPDGIVTAADLAPDSVGTSEIADSVTLVTPNLGIPSAVTLTNATFPTGHVIGMAFMADVYNGSRTGGAAGSWVERELQTKVFNTNCPTTISGDAWTFDEAGTYAIFCIAPSMKANSFSTRIYQDGVNTLVATGLASYGGDGEPVSTAAFACGSVTISASQITGGGSVQDFGIYQYNQSAQGTYGHGIDFVGSTDEQYTQIIIWRLA